MRKFLWATLIVLFVTINAPSAHADTYAATFTCAGTCAFLPTASDVSFPAPTTIDVTWDATLFPINLSSGSLGVDQFNDVYTWQGIAGNPAFPGEAFFAIQDVSTGDFMVDTASLTGLVTLLPDQGSLTFSPVTTPEPSSVALMLIGVGLVFVMWKRINHGLAQG
jgi:hypothetical protein